MRLARDPRNAVLRRGDLAESDSHIPIHRLLRATRHRAERQVRDAASHAHRPLRATIGRVETVLSPYWVLARRAPAAPRRLRRRARYRAATTLSPTDLQA